MFPFNPSKSGPWRNPGLSLRIEHRRGSLLNRFSGNWKAKLPKTCAKRKKIPTNQANELGISGSNPSAEPQQTYVVGFGHRPCAATTTSEVMEPAKARRRQVHRDDG